MDQYRKTSHASSDDNNDSSDSSDSEDKEKKFAEQKAPSHRPSFVIGGSDSDSTIASVDNNASRIRKTSSLNTIPGSSDDVSQAGPSQDLRNVSVAKRGYLGGPGSKSPLRIKSEGNLDEEEGGEGPHLESLSESEEVRLFAVSGNQFNFSRRQWMTFFIFGVVEFCAAMVVSLQAPFYPAEAEKKGASATEYGLVFGIFELTVFLFTPLYGSYVHKLGPKSVFDVGIFVTGLSAVIFGLLDMIQGRAFFVGLSIGTRILEALGESAFIASSFVIIASEFPQSIATTTAIMETFYGFGLIIGPVVGGLLYQLGGFILPFLVIGTMLLLSSLFTTIALPNSRVRRRDDSSDASSNFSMFTLVKIPSVFLSAFGIFCASTSTGYLNATLEPHIRMFQLSPFAIGAIFIINGAFYGVFSPLWGFICDRIKPLKLVMLVGAVMVGVGFALIGPTGPTQYVPLETTLWGVIVGQIIQGIGLGAVLVSSFILALRSAILNGYADGVKTYALVSGLWTSIFALGSFVGPAVSGVLYDWIGFRDGSLFVLSLQALLIFLCLAFMCCSKEPPIVPEGGEEKEPLINSTSSSRERDGNYGSTSN